MSRNITDPETRASVWDRERAELLIHGSSRPGAAALDAASQTLPIGAPGSGSDFATFVDHLGIASLNLGFGGEDHGGTYHSAYDTPWYIEHFGDKQSLYGYALAQTAGTLVMRFADADVLPYDFSNLAETLKTYTAELKALHSQLQREAATRKRNLDMGLYSLAADPEHPVRLPGPLASPPDLDFSGLGDAINALAKAAETFNQARTQIYGASPETLAKINGELALAERKFLNPQGLPRRPWVEHLLYAPGVYTGYGAKTMPGVREALEQSRYSEAAEQLVILTHAVESEAAYIQFIAGQMKNP